MKLLKYSGIYLIGIIAFALCGCKAKVTQFHVFADAQNDLLQIVKNERSIVIIHYDSPLEAVISSKEGDAILILSDNYPNAQVNLNDEFYDIVKEKKLRSYIEYPSYVPDVVLDSMVKAKAERAVISQTSFFGEGLDGLQILSVNGMHYLPNDAEQSFMVAAKVAGFDSAIYGLPDKADPLLFQWQDQPVLISTTNMSQFISGRYAPQQEWASLWNSILQYLVPDLEVDEMDWESTVTSTYGENEDLPEDYQKISIKRGVQWYKNARMLVPGNFEDTLQMILDAGSQHLNYNSSISIGDGSAGVFECIFSEIDEDGSQPIGIIKRGDCISETAMAFATTGELLDSNEYEFISKNLLDFYLIHSIATKKEYGDPDHPAYGLIPWGISNHAWFKASYGDDNARFLLGALVASALMEVNHWDEKLMKSLVALIRTTGKNGFRGSRIDLSDFEENGWQYYGDRDIVNLSPHFEAYLWACYLWGYDQTGDPLFLDTAEKGIKMMMEHYPDGWTWTSGLAQEKARMILPLAWLVRVKDNPANRELLMTVAGDLIKLQDKTGAIREELGEIEMGKYPPPQSNEAYGTTEASLIAQNGDMVSDLLYTTNFAFLGLHEAAYATGDPGIKAAEDKLAEFLCRIQVESKEHPELDGMRAFDFKRWEHWGSNSDHGWGAWAIESGWTQGWIITILGLREMDTSVWDLVKQSEAAKYYLTLKEDMFEDEK